MGETGGIDVIDFGAFLDGSRKQEVADAIVQSFQDIGFVYLVNHGLSQENLDGMFDWVRPRLPHQLQLDHLLIMLLQSKRFFSQPTDVKLLAPHPASGSHHRGLSQCLTITTPALSDHPPGYSAPGVEKVVKDVFDTDELKKRRIASQDVKESFECGREDDPAMPNIWLPDGVLPGFREACLDFFSVCPLSLQLLTWAVLMRVNSPVERSNSRS